ncbi:pol, partial [Symbiodinium sp. CCMP2592]
SRGGPLLGRPDLMGGFTQWAKGDRGRAPQRDGRGHSNGAGSRAGSSEIRQRRNRRRYWRHWLCGGPAEWRPDRPSGPFATGPSASSLNWAASWRRATYARLRCSLAELGDALEEDARGRKKRIDQSRWGFLRAYQGHSEDCGHDLDYMSPALSSDQVNELVDIVLDDMPAQWSEQRGFRKGSNAVVQVLHSDGDHGGLAADSAGRLADIRRDRNGAELVVIHDLYAEAAAAVAEEQSLTSQADARVAGGGQPGSSTDPAKTPAAAAAEEKDEEESSSSSSELPDTRAPSAAGPSVAAPARRAKESKPEHSEEESRASPAPPEERGGEARVGAELGKAEALLEKAQTRAKAVKGVGGCFQRPCDWRTTHTQRTWTPLWRAATADDAMGVDSAGSGGGARPLAPPIVPEPDADGSYKCDLCDEVLPTVPRWHLHRAAEHGRRLPAVEPRRLLFRNDDSSQSTLRKEEWPRGASEETDPASVAVGAEGRPQQGGVWRYWLPVYLAGGWYIAAGADVISRAKARREKLYLRAYSFDSPSVIEAIELACGRGALCNIIADSSQCRRTKLQWQALKRAAQAGARVRLCSGSSVRDAYVADGRGPAVGAGLKGLHHAKALLRVRSDGAELVVGSLNWSTSSKANLECGVHLTLLQDAESVGDFVRDFDTCFSAGIKLEDAKPPGKAAGSDSATGTQQPQRAEPAAA